MFIAPTTHFSINCPTVICSSTVCYVLEREGSSENYGPGSTFLYIEMQKYLPVLFFILFYFAIYLITYHYEILSLQMTIEGINNPLVCVGCKYLLLCV